MPLKLKQYEQAVHEYFQQCDECARPYTVSGLAASLGLTRTELIDLRLKGRLGRQITIAVSRCETFAEERLLDGKNLTGVMFSLKNNFGWLEKVNSGESALEIIVSQPGPEDKPGQSDNPDPAGRISALAGGDAETFAGAAFGPDCGAPAGGQN